VLYILHQVLYNSNKNNCGQSRNKKTLKSQNGLIFWDGGSINLTRENFISSSLSVGTCKILHINLTREVS
jgi:hypothetical protein